MWVDGPDGEPWEIYTVLADVEMAPGELRTVEPGRGRDVLRGGTRVRRPLLLTTAWIVISLGARRAEVVGTALLVAIVVGSGISAQRLSPGDVGLQLLENSIATGAGLVALILALGPVSGAHFNPVVTLADRILGGMTTRDAGVYVVAQVAGGCVGAMVANLMFDLPAVDVSTHTRRRAAGSGSARSSRRSGCCS